MKETTAVSLATAVSVVALMTFLSIWAYFGCAANTEQAKNATIRITACIDSGNTWIERSGDCVK